MSEIKDTIKEMFEAGAHFGFSKRSRHPSIKPYIFGSKNKVEIIDLEKTVELLEKAQDFVTSLAKDGKKILFVGAKAETREFVREGAEKIGMPFVSERWKGGTITNYSEISKRIKRLLDFKSKKEKGELDKYTKKERLLIDREIEKLEKNFGGLVSTNKLPDALFVIDSKREIVAVKEAIDKGIPIVALASTDCNISEIDYPIVANDSARPSVQFFINKIVEAYKI